MDGPDHPRCAEACEPAGIIGWPADLAGNPETHASVLVCDSPAHQQQARDWVQDVTGHDGVFRSLGDARAAAAQKQPGTEKGPGKYP